MGKRPLPRLEEEECCRDMSYGDSTIEYQVEAFIVGPLGVYSNENEHLMMRLVSKSYAKLFRKLCVSDSVRWS